MSIAPVTCSVDVNVPAARAFDLFSRNMGAWWPRGKTPGGRPHVDLIVEPHRGGRWFERDAQGQETLWGKVLAWEPPRRLLLGWQLDHRFRFDSRLLMEVEILFEERVDGGTRVRLEHRDLEQLGVEADPFAGRIGTGWPERLDNFARHAAANA